MPLLSPKAPAEEVFITWALGRVLSTGITVVTATCVPAVLEGEDVDVADMITVPAEIIDGGKAVRQLVEAGLVGVLYDLSLTFVTSDGQTFVECVTLPIEDRCGA